MKNSIKFFILVSFIFISLTFISTITYATTIKYAGALKVDITTDKTNYVNGENVIFTVTVKEVSNNTLVENAKVEILIYTGNPSTLVWDSILKYGYVMTNSNGVVTLVYTSDKLGAFRAWALAWRPGETGGYGSLYYTGFDVFQPQIYESPFEGRYFCRSLPIYKNYCVKV